MLEEIEERAERNYERAVSETIKQMLEELAG